MKVTTSYCEPPMDQKWLKYFHIADFSTFGSTSNGHATQMPPRSYVTEYGPIGGKRWLIISPYKCRLIEKVLACSVLVGQNHLGSPRSESHTSSGLCFSSSWLLRMPILGNYSVTFHQPSLFLSF